MRWFSFTEILTNICLRKNHNATITRIFALFRTFFTNAFSPTFCLKMLLKNEYCDISRGISTEIFSPSKSKCVDLCVAILEVLCGRGRYPTEGQK